MLTRDDFVGQLIIKELHGNSSANEGIREAFDLFRKEYEAKFLKTLFNSTFLTDYNSGIAEATPETKWTDLRDMIKKPCARFVYFHFIRENSTQTTPSGEVQAQFEGAVIVSNNLKLTTQWNAMSDECNDTYEYLQQNETDYPNFDLFETFLPSGRHPLSRISLIQ